jgi:transposase
MGPLSPDLRQRIVETYEAGGVTQAALADRFKVGKASVERLVRLKRDTGALAPKPHAGGRTAQITEADRETLLATFARAPDTRQADLADAFAADGRPVSQQTVSRALRRLGITRKKSP